MEAGCPPATSNCSPAGGVASSHPCTLPLSQERQQDTQTEIMDVYDVAAETTVGHYLLRAAHDGHLSVHEGVNALRVALLGSLDGQHTLVVATLVVVETELVDVLDYLSGAWDEEVVALRSQADSHGMRMMKTVSIWESSRHMASSVSHSPQWPSPMPERRNFARGW